VGRVDWPLEVAPSSGWEPALPNGLSRLTAAEVREVMHSQFCGGLSEALSAGGEESAEEATGFEFLEACLPALGGGAEAIENPGQLGGDNRLAFAKEPAGVVDEEQVVCQ
jgi:hypothetical protein